MLSSLPTPALLVDVERLERNIARMAAGTPVPLRPHVKTSKCWEVVRRQLAAGAVGVTCATPSEAAWLLDAGVTDVLWAHVPIGPWKVAFAVDAARAGRLTVSLDSVEAGFPLAAAAASAGVTVPFVLEVDTGHGRLGVSPSRAVEVGSALAALPGLRLRGVLTHEGHVAGEPDRAALERAGVGAGALLVSAATRLRDAGHRVEVVSVGSTPGVTSAPTVPGVTEARPGTYVYYDAHQVRLGSCTFDDCALTVLARVVSVRPSGRAIIDAGVKAMSSDLLAGAGVAGVIIDQDGRPREGVVFADANEEHGFVDADHHLRVGDLVRIVPNHACGTTNMWSHLYAIRRSAPPERWEIAARY